LCRGSEIVFISASFLIFLLSFIVLRCRSGTHIADYENETEIGATAVALHGRERGTKVNYRAGRRTTGPGDYSNVSLCSDARSRPIWTLFQTSVTFPRRTERRNHAAEFSSHASIH